MARPPFACPAPSNVDSHAANTCLENSNVVFSGRWAAIHALGAATSVVTELHELASGIGIPFPVKEIGNRSRASLPSGAASFFCKLGQTAAPAPHLSLCCSDQ